MFDRLDVLSGHHSSFVVFFENDCQTIRIYGRDAI